MLRTYRGFVALLPHEVMAPSERGEVKDVEEDLSQPAQWCPWPRFFGFSVRCVRSVSNGSDGLEWEH